MKTSIKTLFLGKTKKGRAASVIVYILLLYLLVITFFPFPFFSEKYETNYFTFYSNDNSTEFRLVCDEIAAKEKALPMIKPEKQIKFFFTDSLLIYRLLSPLSMNSMGITRVIGNSVNIILAPSDFSKKIVTSGAKENNIRNIITTAVHEIVHVYLSKGHILRNRFSFPKWIEEGLCEYYAGDSSFDTEIGMQHIMNGIKDSSRSFEYFTWRTAVSWLIDTKGYKMNEVLTFKGSLETVLDDIRKISSNNRY